MCFFRSVLLLMFFGVLSVKATAMPPAYDPITEDPVMIDTAYPSSSQYWGIESGGATMNALVYMAAGAGPHPVAILLHGLPGGDGSPDLAQVLRRAGWTVVSFRYRGAWGSEGSFSFANALEDVKAAVVAVAGSGFAKRFRADNKKITLVGTSMGGFMALRSGAYLTDVDCIASIVGSNMGAEARMVTGNPELRTAMLKLMALLTKPLRGTSPQMLLDEGANFTPDYDLLQHVNAIGTKRVLLVGGLRDTDVPVQYHHNPLTEVLRESGAKDLTSLVFNADHSFADRRIALARALLNWMEAGCR